MTERTNVAGVCHGDHVVDLGSGWHGCVVDLQGDGSGVAGWIKVMWLHDPRCLTADIFWAEEIKERWFTSGDDKIKWEISPSPRTPRRIQSGGGNT